MTFTAHEMVVGNQITLGGALVWEVGPRGFRKDGMTPTFQGHVILGAERQWMGSLKVKTDLRQGSYWPKM